jgi:hypothetical protein
VGEDQFLSKKEWLRMHGITDDSFVLAICAGAEAYRLELESLAKKTLEKENKE